MPHNTKMRIPQLSAYRGRNPRGYFHDLPPDARQRAYAWLDRFVKRWQEREGTIPPWRFAILVGQAKRLALNPPDSSWGRKMLAKRGGLAVQRRYRAEGRDPTEYATLCRVTKLRARKRARADGWTPESTGGIVPARVILLPLD